MGMRCPGPRLSNSCVRITETARHPGLVGNPNVGLYPLTPQPEWLRWQMSLFIGLPLKAVWQSYDLFCTLAYTAPAAKWIIIQVR